MDGEMGLELGYIECVDCARKDVSPCGDDCLIWLKWDFWILWTIIVDYNILFISSWRFGKGHDMVPNFIKAYIIVQNYS